MHERVPFNSLIIEKSFIEPGLPIQDIYTLKDNPEVIVRAGMYDEYDGTEDRYGCFQEHLDNRDLLNKLQDQYGLFIPDFDIVVGGHKRFYIVTQKVHGVNLHYRTFAEDETDEAKGKLDKFYSTLGDVLIDAAQSGGKMIGDLTRAGADKSGNKQWVYGKRKGDLENQVWLVDLGPCVTEYIPPHDKIFCINQFPWLFEMIVESEKKLGCRFDEAREKVLDYLKTERSTFSDTDLIARQIDMFFRHQQMFGNIL